MIGRFNVLKFITSMLAWVTLGVVAGFVAAWADKSSLAHLVGAWLTNSMAPGSVYTGDVNTTTFLADAKVVYGMLQDQISTQAILINLMNDGSKFGKPINDIGIKGYTFLARLQPNWNMGFRKEGKGGVGAAGAQGLQNSTVVLKYAYVPTLITGQAQNLTQGNNRAFMQAKALEAKFDTKDLLSHINVIIAGCERGGQLAQVSASVANTSFTASTAGNLPGAIYLRVGMPVDAAPTAGGALSLTNQQISAINYATGVCNIAAGTATVGHGVYLAGESASATTDFPMTCEGLMSLVSDTTAIQGLDPAIAGQNAWKSYLRDVGAVTISPPLLMEMAQFTKNRGGEEVNMYLVPSAQINQYVAIATATLRFDVAGPGAAVGKKALDLGFSVYDFMGKPMIEDKDLRPDRIFAGASDTLCKFEAVPLSMANDGAGDWTRVSGSNGIADAIQGLLRWYFNIGTIQRSAWSLYKNFTVPTAFQNTPPTL